MWPTKEVSTIPSIGTEILAMMFGIASLRISRFIMRQPMTMDWFPRKPSKLFRMVQPKHLTSLSFWSIFKKLDVLQFLFILQPNRQNLRC